MLSWHCPGAADLPPRELELKTSGGGMGVSRLQGLAFRVSRCGGVPQRFFFSLPTISPPMNCSSCPHFLEVFEVCVVTKEWGRIL